MLLLEDKIAKIVSHIYICEEFGGDPESDDYGTALDSIYDEMRHINPHIQVKHGVSKAVIVIPECEKVIKVPFNGYYDTSACKYYKEETERYEYDASAERWIPFHNANHDYDYCADELAYYLEAENAGLAKCFAETSFYGYAKYQTPIYLQEKSIALCDDDSCRRSSQWAKEVVKWNDWEDKIDKFWIELAVDYYGEEVIGELIDFLEANNLLDDLHRGNIGFSEKDGRPVLIDFSGWWD
jgi:hypothetical protein